MNNSNIQNLQGFLEDWEKEEDFSLFWYKILPISKTTVEWRRISTRNFQLYYEYFDFE